MRFGFPSFATTEARLSTRPIPPIESPAWAAHRRSCSDASAACRKRRRIRAPASFICKSRARDRGKGFGSKPGPLRGRTIRFVVATHVGQQDVEPLVALVACADDAFAQQAGQALRGFLHLAVARLGGVAAV